MAGNPLKPVCIAGILLTALVSFSMVFFGVIWRGGIPDTANRGIAGNSFARELRDFDQFDAPRRVLAGENPAQIERRLSRLERQARGVEEHLSVLKRRRALALLDRRYLASYERAAREAAAAFPFSAPLAAVAAEAVMLAGPVNARALLGTYAERLTQQRFAPLQLAVHILAGNLDDPVQASGIPGLENLLSHTPPGTLSESARRNLLVNEFLLRAVRGDIPGASARLDALLAAADSAAIDESGIRRMAAEFFFDHHNPRRAAEIFARLAGEAPGDHDIIRLADSLALAGEIPGARNIWFILTANPNPAAGHAAARSRVFYNMAASSTDSREEVLWLEQLFSYRAQRGQIAMDRTGIYSLIRYTRLLDTHRGVAVLSEAITSTGAMPPAEFAPFPGAPAEPVAGRLSLLDLELLRRNLDAWPPGRAAAEVWLLLNRHSGDDAIHQWAAWYFEHRRLYAESRRLLNDAARNGISGTWIDLHRALAYMREGAISDGEIMLRELGTGSQDWRVFANLGRIYESRRQLSSALEAYEIAAVLVDERTAAAQVQLRLSRNLEALGRVQESRAALERALELDPDNLNIRREARRLM